MANFALALKRAISAGVRANAQTKPRPAVAETKTSETKTAGEMKNRKRGRPRRKTVAPWTAAGVSRATWYRRKA